MISAIRTRFDAIFDATLGRLWVARVWDGIDRQMPSTRTMLGRADVLLALGLGLIGMAVSVWAFSQTSRVPEIHTMFNIWLDGDVARVAENMVTTSGDHGRTSVHPIFSILLYPFGKLLTLLGADPLTAAKTLIVLVMGGNVALFSLTVRLLGLPRTVGALFTLLFMSTASFLFWGGVIESFQFSCFSVLLALFMMVRVKTAHWGWWILINVLTLGFLVTNWMFGLIAMAVRLNLKPFVAIAAVSFSLVVFLSAIQNMTFERAAVFINPETLIRETQYLQPQIEDQGGLEEGWRPLANLRSIYVTTVVAMPVYVQQHTHMRLMTTNQNSGFPEGEVFPVMAVIAWVVLFGMGIWGATRRGDIRLPLMGAGLMLALQSALHILYGAVTFLYSLSWMPLLLLFAALAWYAPYRKVAMAMASLVILLGALNNERRMQKSVRVAGCLSELENVKTLQTWELIRDNPPRERAPDPDLYVSHIDLCDTKTPA